MTGKFNTICSSLLLVAFLCTGCAKSTPEPTALPTAVPTKMSTPTPKTDTGELDGRTLVEWRCIECHDQSRFSNISDTYTGYRTVEERNLEYEGWKSIVEKMVEYGANLNADEQEAVIKYLTEINQ
jgi:hypothetical protein